LITDIELTLTPYQAYSEEQYKPVAAKKAGISPGDISYIRIIRKSIDARSRAIKVNLSLKLYINEPLQGSIGLSFRYQPVHSRPEILVIGAGPAGLAAALRLIELGARPVILERGKPVEERIADIRLLENNQPVNADSNYCFGEGGAGTYSDGKLYTRSKKRGDISRILELFAYHGAPEAILYEAHPHIGSDNLPGVVKKIRETILSCGGVIHYNARVTDFVINGNSLSKVITQQGQSFESQAVILATGHSSRDVYELLQRRSIALESKLFAMGVRVEHPQELIDSIQYHGKKTEFLPAASYNLVEQVEKRGVYSFCMCPGGQVVPAATAPGEIVVNGMSVSQRNSPFANSGIVVQITENDLKPFSRYGALAGLSLQQQLEQQCFRHAGSGQKAPAQRLTDFVNQKTPDSLPGSSYLPGTTLSDLSSWLPRFINDSLREGFKRFDSKMKGFLTKEAVIHGVESRTSSPVRIPRKDDTRQHIHIENLFPCGEGSGYAGGIISSAIDGEISAEKCLMWLGLGSTAPEKFRAENGDSR
jgi:uncharacterized FAD-dependent dehydrogenase